mmetsp:Transcript_9120/g.12997  ORF Transcript_9120/g.12997 Transcript_9120/m.12997 type:complete len:133 (-) Transcript_9120:337-735(-)
MSTPFIQKSDIDDTDEEELMNVEIFPTVNETILDQTTTNHRLLHQNPLQRPKPDFVWSDKAILECMNIAIKSHDDASASSQVWNPKTTSTASPNKEESSSTTISENETAAWKPRSVALPAWAVDPLVPTQKS